MSVDLYNQFAEKVRDKISSEIGHAQYSVAQADWMMMNHELYYLRPVSIDEVTMYKLRTKAGGACGEIDIAREIAESDELDDFIPFIRRLLLRSFERLLDNPPGGQDVSGVKEYVEALKNE